MENNGVLEDHYSCCEPRPSDLETPAHELSSGRYQPAESPVARRGNAGHRRPILIAQDHYGPTALRNAFGTRTMVIQLITWNGSTLMDWILRLKRVTRPTAHWTGRTKTLPSRANEMVLVVVVMVVVDEEEAHRSRAYWHLS